MKGKFKCRLPKNMLKRFQYRLEFVKRSKALQEYKEEIGKMLYRHLSKKRGKPWNQIEISKGRENEKLFALTSKLIPPVRVWSSGAFLSLCPKVALSFVFGDFPLKGDIEECIAFRNMANIEVVYNEEGKSPTSSYLEYLEPLLFAYMEEKGEMEEWRRKRKEGIESFSVTLDAVNNVDKTITVKIHLDRQKGAIQADLKYLLDLLDTEAELLGVDYPGPKRPQWDVYDKYLQVDNMKRANPKMVWSEIAKKVFPDEIYRPAAHKRISKKSELAQRSAIDKVRHYWREAMEMIDKEGWKRI